jgi:methanogenic corrinoid protein MtbC1
MMPLTIDRFQNALLALDRIAARNVVRQIQTKQSPVQIVDTLIRPVLERIGAGWERGEIALAQVYMSGRICEEIVDLLLPPRSPDRKGQPHLAIASLEDYHALGKRIVYSMLRSGGFDLLDHGQMKADALAHRAAQDEIEVLLISVLMFPSALRVRDVRRTLDEIAPGTKIVVGGAPFLFDDQLWQRVGADAMGRTAADAAGIVYRVAGGEA